MPNDISFTDPPVSFESPNAALLPWNYVEAALPELIGRGDGKARIVLALPNASQPARYTAISARTLADPLATVDFIARLEGLGLDPADPAPRCFVGPETDLKPYDPHSDAPPEIFEVSAEPWGLVGNQAISQAVLIIDAGIAFWNQRFRGLTGPRFRGVRFLDFNLPNIGQSNLINDVDIAALCDLADQDGSAAVVERLGALYPNSVFGPAANPDPDGLWHGTAIADLAAGAEAGTADDIALFALELPRAVIADYSGATLSMMLALILPAAIGMMANFPDKPLTIVMPLGFPAGPQDGSHPAAAAIEHALATATRRNVRLVLPAGNHLQDRCHARLSGGEAQASVDWDLPPDDHSMNTVEMFGAAGQPVNLTIAAPSQSPASPVTLQQLTYHHVLRDQKRIGILLRGPDTPFGSRTVLALWRTAVTETRAEAPFGRWTLSTSADLRLWLARDDRDPVADRGRPRRPSRFWDAAYTRQDAAGAWLRTDDPGSAIRRSGTLSALATTRSMAAVAVEALERLGAGAAAQAGYSSRREDGLALPARALVDDGWPDRGAMAAANGGLRRVRVSGTSAAAGLHVRSLVMPLLPPEP